MPRRAFKILFLSYMSVASFAFCAEALAQKVSFGSGSTAPPPAAAQQSTTSTTPASSSETIEGCDPKWMDAAKAKAKAKIAYDVAVTEQMIDQPDSVLALSCFNQSAGTSAKAGGEAFSGDFTKQLSKVIQSALKDSYSNFQGSSGFKDLVKFKADASGGAGAGVSVGGAPTGTNVSVQGLDYTATDLVAGENCNAGADMWEKDEEEGVDQEVPYVSSDALTNDLPPLGAGDDMKRSWKASADQGVFRDLKKKKEALPKANVPDFSGDEGSCASMKKAGIANDCKDE